MTIPTPHHGRRAVVAALASLPLGCSAAERPEGAAAGRSNARTLVAWFSRSGNTRVVAGLIHRSMPSDLFEIQPAADYPIIRSLLSQHDMGGKTIVPFITHGGFGVGSSLRVVASHAPNARILDAFVMQADQERKTMESVNAWLATPHTAR